MKIGILGTRGIPNYHGGFEQFAEVFSVYLKEKGHEVFVYCSNNHPYQEQMYQGVQLIHCKDPEDRVGTVGQFVYDYYCIKDAQKRNFDILLQLGYTSNSVWYKLLPKKAIIITNMDGLEWKRSKYSKAVRKFLKYAEKLAVKSSDYLISDSIGIQDYLMKTYQKESTYIAYGATLFKNPSEAILNQYQVEPYAYHMLIARMEPENSIETILDGVAASKTNTPFLVVGKHDVNPFGAYLKKKFAKNKNIRFVGGIYNLEYLNNLRYFSKLYFHGHTVGGTNPSLLEAMASNALIVAHNNEFNKAILNTEAFYFSTSEEVSRTLEEVADKSQWKHYLEANLQKIERLYDWDIINEAYVNLMERCYASH
ncbi:MAG: glycosyl transferase family 1 [Alteromonas sp.]|nr:glycosyl transferase family 1 [Alteromonas sp.]